ncbi:MAG: hypothetical protein ACTHKS_00440 [Gaiellaceae bacterium]
MTKADHAVDTAADKVAAFVRNAHGSGGIKGKLGDAFADDPEFIRKLKPSLIKARAKGQKTVEPAPTAPSGPQIERPKANRRRRGASPWLVVGAAFAAGYVLAKTIDWRAHAHPRL